MKTNLHIFYIKKNYVVTEIIIVAILKIHKKRQKSKIILKILWKIQI